MSKFTGRCLAIDPGQAASTSAVVQFENGVLVGIATLPEDDHVIMSGSFWLEAGEPIEVHSLVTMRDDGKVYNVNPKKL